MNLNKHTKLCNYHHDQYLGHFYQPKQLSHVVVVVVVVVSGVGF